MSGRHSSETIQGPRITALPKTLKLVAMLAPRQLNDEIRLAKEEIKRKATQVGVAGAFFGVALVFLTFLVVALIVAAILGLATVMPGWLAALLVAALFLLIVAIGAVTGLLKFKKAMPLMPEDTIRGIKHDLGIAKEGTSFDARKLDPNSEQGKAEKAAKEAEAAKAKAEKAAKAAARDADEKPVSEAELRRRLGQRRDHLASVRDELDVELDVKTQGKVLLDAAGRRLDDGRNVARRRLSALGESLPDDLPERLAARWKALAAFAVSATVLVVLLRRLFRQ
ncbi:phage holin family protein [Arthrobacter sp. ISL-30]|uniref:phage holin family protein n=1 Tax=Arthrobacter sp. ISL-30 TaxID=2819109 RepID=UPI001BEB55CC|nr:phage holin family protein [Arthrobacter sp. ISL-30]MBT2513184.1 phage holin family protein [Arthrobacter sp. ISL-30]